MQRLFIFVFMLRRLTAVELIDTCLTDPDPDGTALLNAPKPPLPHPLGKKTPCRFLRHRLSSR